MGRIRGGPDRFGDERPTPFPPGMGNDEIEPLVRPYLPRNLVLDAEIELGRKPETAGCHSPGCLVQVQPLGHGAMVANGAHPPVTRG
jgi:hypothetical protein